MLLWLWYRPVATALIRPLAWKPPYAVGAALEKDKKTKKKKILICSNNIDAHPLTKQNEWILAKPRPQQNLVEVTFGYTLAYGWGEWK